MALFPMIRNAGKILANAGKGYHRHLSQKTITTYTKPLPCPPSLKEYGFTLKTCASLQADFFDSIYQTPPPPFQEVVLGHIVESVSHFTPFLVPFASINAFTHSVLLAFVLYLEPRYFIDQATKLMKDMETSYMSYRGVTRRFLAGISESNFRHFCAVSNFVFSPARTMATYKDFFIDEIKQLRKEGSKERRLMKARANKKKKKVDWDVVTTANLMLVLVKNPGENIRVFVCVGTVMLFEGQLFLWSFKLPKFPYHPALVLANFKDGKLMIEFPLCPEMSDYDISSRCFRLH